jgi:hypothetical protein
MEEARQERRARGTVISGRIVTSLVVLLLLLDAFGKLATLAPVIEGTARLGYPTSLVLVIGSIEFLCTVAYVIPGTSVLGAVLLTGYFGGAVASHVRIEDALWTHVFSPVYMGILVWAGVVLREARLRSLIPWRRKPALGASG